MRNEKLINKITRNLNSYCVNEANTNTDYGTSQLLNSNLYFANSNNDWTSDSSRTPQTPLKGSERPITKSVSDLTIGLLTPTEKTIKNVETNSSGKTYRQWRNMKKSKSKVLKKISYKIYGIPLRKYLTENLQSWIYHLEIYHLLI